MSPHEYYYKHYILYLVFRQGKKKKKKSGESSSSTTTTNNFDGETDSDEPTSKKNNINEEAAGSSAAQPKNISELNSYDLDEYLGPVWEAETSTGNGSTQQVPVPDPLPVLNTIDLGVLMESDEETLLETVIRLSGQDINLKILLDILTKLGLKNSSLTPK